MQKSKDTNQEPRQKRIIGIPAKPVTYHANVSKKEPGNIDYVDLPIPGKSRWRDIAPHCPFSREKFRQLSIEGRAPQPERMGIRMTFYDNAEIRKWLSDPLNYRVEG